MQFRRNGTKIRWRGQERELPLPASIACNSPWLDITQSAPAWQGEQPHTFDYLPKPGVIYKHGIAPCDIWPATPRRRLLYVDDEMATHPLASLVMCDSWEGCPPVYMCTGWEILSYEDKYMAKKLATECSVPVVFEEYEAMPHCFAMILDHHSGSRRCYDGWAAFIRQSVDAPASIDSSAVYIKSRTLKEIPLSFEKLTDTSDNELRGRVTNSCKITVHEVPSKL
jgi:acetyl esterase/lipase